MVSLVSVCQVDTLVIFGIFVFSECYSNGTMTALSVKLESVPNLVPQQLTLRDKSCKPYFSDDRFAHFSFNVNSCGTSRVVSRSPLDGNNGNAIK